jgi:putative transcriptional regulator
MNKNKSSKIKLNNHNFGALLIESMEEAVQHSKGKITLNSERLELPDEPPIYSKTKIKNIREKLLEVSQPVFASILACSPSAIKSWERGENSPNGTTRRLLQLIERDPAYFLKSITDN